MKRYAPVSFPQHSTNKPLSPEPNPHLSPIFPPAPVIRNKPHDPGTPNERPPASCTPTHPHRACRMSGFPTLPSSAPRSIRQTASCSVNRTSTVLPSGSGSQKCHDCPKSSFSGLIIVFMYSSGTCFFPFRFVCPVTMGGGYEFFGWFR